VLLGINNDLVVETGIAPPPDFSASLASSGERAS
jgi:hypothetical protein